MVWPGLPYHAEDYDVVIAFCDDRLVLCLLHEHASDPRNHPTYAVLSH